MLYRLCTRFNDDFGLLVFGGYLLAFLLAFIMVFIFPPGALALVLLGLAGFVGVWVVMSVSRGLERALARTRIREHECPACGDQLGTISGPGDPEELHRCAGCAQDFEPDGRRFQWDEEDEDEGEQDERAL